MELVLPNHRVFYYSILESFLPVGGILIAYIASLVKNWRLLLRVSNIPGLMFISYYWLLWTCISKYLFNQWTKQKIIFNILFTIIYRLTEESMRWLEIQGKHDKVVNALKKIAAANKKDLPNPESQIKKEVMIWSLNHFWIIPTTNITIDFQLS